MVTAYILIEMVAGHSRALAETLISKPGVKDVDRVTGPWDVIAVIEAEDINGISDVVNAEIHTLPGIVRTTTCVSLE